MPDVWPFGDEQAFFSWISAPVRSENGPIQRHLELWVSEMVPGNEAGLEKVLV